MKASFLKQFKIITWVIKAFVEKHFKILILSLFVGVGGFLIILKVLPFLPEPKKVYRVGLIGKYNLDNLPESVEKRLGLGLTIISENNQAIPGLADSWIISEDGLKYTFKLKDNLYWQDGTKLTAYDINYSFKDVEKKVINNISLQFILKEPFSPFLIILTRPIFKENFIGAGRYKIENYNLSNEQLQNITITSSRDKIVYNFYPNIETAKIAFQLGEIDILENLILNPFDSSWNNNIKISKQINKDQYTAIFINNQTDLLKEKEFRQALAYSLDFISKSDKRAFSPISPDSWAYNENIKRYDYDKEKAQKIIKSYKNENNDLTIKISTSEAFLSLAEEIKRSWQDTLEIKVEIEILNTFNPNFDAFLGIQEIPLDPDQYTQWHSTSEANITKFNDPRIDKLLEDGRKITDTEKRKEKYLDFQKFLLEEIPAIFISHPVLYTISRSTVSYLQF